MHLNDLKINALHILGFAGFASYSIPSPAADLVLT